MKCDRSQVPWRRLKRSWNEQRIPWSACRRRSFVIFVVIDPRRSEIENKWGDPSKKQKVSRVAMSDVYPWGYFFRLHKVGIFMYFSRGRECTTMKFHGDFMRRKPWIYYDILEIWWDMTSHNYVFQPLLHLSGYIWMNFWPRAPVVDEDWNDGSFFLCYASWAWPNSGACEWW